MTHYEVLGIPQNASQEQIKAAYRALAKKYHPDVNDAQNANAFFRLIQEAYETLSNPQKRVEYDSPEPEYEEPPQQQQQVVHYYESDWAAQRRHIEEMIHEHGKVVQACTDARHQLALFHTPKVFRTIFIIRLFCVIICPIVRIFYALVGLISILSVLLWGVAGILAIPYLLYTGIFVYAQISQPEIAQWGDYLHIIMWGNTTAGKLLVEILLLAAMPFLIKFLDKRLERLVSKYNDFIKDIPYLWKHRKEAHK